MELKGQELDRPSPRAQLGVGDELNRKGKEISTLQDFISHRAQRELADQKSPVGLCGSTSIWLTV